MVEGELHLVSMAAPHHERDAHKCQQHDGRAQNTMSSSALRSSDFDVVMAVVVWCHI